MTKTRSYAVDEDLDGTFLRKCAISLEGMFEPSDHVNDRNNDQKEGQNILFSE